MTNAGPATRFSADAAPAPGELAARFPSGFVWGAAIAAYQIEGSAGVDGRGPSIWDTFSHTAGRTFSGDTGDVACDHYARLESDLDLMAALNLGAYRFSVAWPRVQPFGEGAPNPAGLAFYDRLVDGLLERGIEPWLTLYHWDLPQPLEDRGGWPERDIVGRFAEYARIVVDRLGDRVQHWITLNEPWVFTFVGYGDGRHAPGRRDWPAALLAAHHAHLAHREAVAAIRAGVPAAQVGISLNLAPVEAATETAGDVTAARLHDGALNCWWLDPIFGRGYPLDMIAAFGPLLRGVDVRELDEAARPLDFIGVNYYTRARMAAPSRDRPQGGPLPLVAAPGALPVTAMGWEVDPDGLRRLLVRLTGEYAPAALAITENGAAYADVVASDGSVVDTDRLEYIRDHVAAAADAIDEGVPLVAYFAWSLLDNFEWAEGYAKRFGIVHVDYATQRRTVKASGEWYAALADAARGPDPSRPVSRTG
ncbi:MAG: beta-glucosidase [Chloroflexi bacterium]|nr:beta-glucosidase [Chloroflexota bacterium]